MMKKIVEIIKAYLERDGYQVVLLAREIRSGPGL
jgi:hypothetical protein